jgi:hypothetical protein
MFWSKMKFAIVMLASTAAIAGCASNSEQTIVPANSSEIELVHTFEAGEKAAAAQVMVSRSMQFGYVNTDIYGIFKQAEDVRVFEDAFRNASRIMGILDARRPDYDIVVNRNGVERSVHLWLQPRMETGMYTEVDDTGTGYRLTAAATETLKKMIWGLYYDEELAKQNGNVVQLMGKWSNLNKWHSFVENVKEGKADTLHVTSYTFEGGPIFYDLLFDGSQIEYTFDNTHDAYGSPIKPTSACSAITKKKKDKGKEYRLTGCVGSELENPTFSLLIP